MMQFRLGWPDTTLSPNARQHWAALAKAKKSYRLRCWSDVLIQHQIERQPIPDGPLRVELVFHPRTRRSMDIDNLIARMKSGLDGLCEALGFDDRRFAVIAGRMAETTGGYVEVRISADAEGADH